MKKSESLARNTILLTTGTLMTKGLSFVMVPFFSRWLSTEDYGEFDLLCTFVSLLIPLIGLCSSEALFRFSMDESTVDGKKNHITNSVAIYFLNFTIASLFIISFKNVFGREIVIPFCIILFAELVNSYLGGFLRAIKRLDIYSYSNAITTISIALFATLFIRVLNYGLIGIILGYGVGFIVGNLVIILYTKWWSYIDYKQLSINRMIALIKYSYVLIPNSVAWWFINVSDRSIIRFFLNSSANGIYALAYKVPNVLSAVLGTFGIAWQQSAIEALGSDERNKYYNEIYNKMFVIIFSLGCGVLSLNSWMFNFVFDLKYYEGHLYTPILLGGTVLATISQFFGGIQIGFRKPGENGVTTLIGALTNIVVHLLLIVPTGLYAASVSTLVSQMVVCILRKKRVERIVAISLKKESISALIIYMIFTVCAYYITNNKFNIICTIIASFYVIFVNRSMISIIAKGCGSRITRKN